MLSGRRSSKHLETLIAAEGVSSVSHTLGKGVLKADIFFSPAVFNIGSRFLVASQIAHSALGHRGS